MTVIRREFRKMAGCTFAECIQSLRDGRAYRFYTAGMAGYFYKAPHPEDPVQTTLDGAVSAITHWHKSLSVPIPPVLMLHEFDDDAQWTIELAACHPLLEKK
jgi:hypothetical protein